MAIEVAADIGIDALYVLGDFVDFYYISAHGPKHPSMVGHLKDEVDQANSGLDTFDRFFPDIPKYYIEGNHEWRLERYIQNKCPELFGLIDCQTLLKINGRPGWHWISYSPTQRLRVLDSQLYVRHEPLGVSAKLSAARALTSFAYGHVHKLESSYIVGLDGQTHVAFSCGFLGDKRMDKAFGYVKNIAQWILGFTLVYVDIETGLFYHQLIHILENQAKLSCCVNGKLYRG